MASGQLTEEEALMSLWALTYKVQKSALDNLEEMLTKVDIMGRNKFNVQNLGRRETARRAVIDANIPLH